jgi:hypothetical protein
MEADIGAVLLPSFFFLFSSVSGVCAGSPITAIQTFLFVKQSFFEVAASLSGASNYKNKSEGK